jgi:hypothetical protein
MRRPRQSGQSLVEWVILAGFIIIGLAAIFEGFPLVLNHFCASVLRFVCGPVL